ncbi:MAG TPA: metal ABC transporter substrate-binding protein [Anaerolineae bacterium]|nr:metal ABC transporter substrate-binding protein [Anaerolineae bacterium]
MQKAVRRTRRLQAVLLVLSLLAAFISACGTAAPAPAAGDPAALTAAPLASGEKLRVVATTSIVGDVVGRIGGGAVELHTLMDLGTDPHTYVATPSDLARVHDAHLLFSNGAGLEEGMAELPLGSAAAFHIRLSDSLALPASALGDQRQAPETDPHVWLDVQNVLAWTQAVSQALCAADPGNCDTYGANAAAYRAELEALDAWIVDQVAPIPAEQRRIVTNHETLAYFARRYGFQIVGAVYPLSPSAEPSAQDLAALEEAIRSYSLSVLFTEGTVSPVLAEQVARDTGVRLVPLYTESLGPDGSGAETYQDLMRYNVQAILAANDN